MNAPTRNYIGYRFIFLGIVFGYLLVAYTFQVCYFKHFSIDILSTPFNVLVNILALYSNKMRTKCFVNFVPFTRFIRLSSTCRTQVKSCSCNQSILINKKRKRAITGELEPILIRKWLRGNRCFAFKFAPFSPRVALLSCPSSYDCIRSNTWTTFDLCTVVWSQSDKPDKR